MKFKIGHDEVSANSPVYLIAEVGTTANGKVETAKKLIDLTKEAGFNAVKFQNISPKDYMSDRTLTYKYMTAQGPKETNMFEMLEPLVFSAEAWAEIMAYARQRDMPCFATVNWLGGVDMMEKLQAPAYKIASWDLNYPDLQKKIFATKKPVFIDLGPVEILEVIKMRQLAASVGNNNVVFLYDFHTGDKKQMHLRAIPYLQETLGEFVGFSSPGKEMDLDLISLGLGAKVLEKRVTLDDQDPGHHHHVAVNPKEALQWVKAMREAEIAMGRKALIPSEGDLNDSKKYFRSVTTLRAMKKGEVFSPENLGAKRPHAGPIHPEHLTVIWGKKAARDLPMDQQIDWAQIDTQ